MNRKYQKAFRIFVRKQSIIVDLKHFFSRFITQTLTRFLAQFVWM